MRNCPSGPQGTLNVLLDRKNRGKPKTRFEDSVEVTPIISNDPKIHNQSSNSSEIDQGMEDEVLDDKILKDGIDAKEPLK